MSHQRTFNSRGEAPARGFSLLEVVVSIGILSVGMLGVASLVTSTMKTGTNSRYVNMANILASEKLDSLNKWPNGDPNVAAGGSLTGPSTCAAGDDYCDQVTMTEASGADYETQTQIINGTSTTTTIVHTNAGCVNTPTACGVPNPVGSSSTFTRRWLITSPFNVTSAGGTTTQVKSAERITVVVTNDDIVQNPVTFQLSMVRP